MLMAPLAPAGTIAAFATTRPSNEFNVETSGCGCPAGQTDRYATGPGGTTVIFREYACAVLGMLHALCGMGILRTTPPEMEGPPNVPVVALVSSTRQGVTGVKPNPPVEKDQIADGKLPLEVRATICQ
jgi:hypothetical protein